MLPHRYRFTLLMTIMLALLPAAALATLPTTVFQDGGYLVHRGAKVILARNPEKLLVPASTWKIATALLALEQLGPDFRFQTAFYLADGHLLIQGFGDPLLVSEEVDRIAAHLAVLGLRELTDIVLDDSFFQLESAIPAGSTTSLRAYDAANGALVVNFNTINIEVKADGTIRSAEEQTPTLPVMRTLAGQLPPGTHRINLSQNAAAAGRYVGELFRDRLEFHGIQVNGQLRTGKTPATAQLLYLHHSSQRLDEIVRLMLLYSNNFVANQLFLTCGAKRFGTPATWAKSRRHLQDFLTELGLPAGSFTVEEGSGLSRENRITPAALSQVLEAFRPYVELLPLWQGRRVKSGTLNGVYAYAGFFRGEPEDDPFVLILNQSANTRDQALDLLERQWIRERNGSGE